MADAPSSSSGATARREARRRKLLLSSEERLKRIKQLNDELRESANSGVPVTTETDSSAQLAGQPHTSASPKQSEEAQEGERTVAALPVEDSQEPRPCPGEAEGSARTEDRSGQSAPCEGNEVAVTDENQAPLEVRINQTASEREEKLEDKTRSISDVSGDCKYVKNDVIPKNTNKSVRFHHSSEAKPVGAAEERVHSVAAASGVPASSVRPQSSPAAHAVSPAAAAASVTAKAGPLVTTRELCVIVVAVLMRVMLATEWLTSIQGQSIIIPFIALQVVFVRFDSQKQAVDGMMARVLSFAAMMSNIPQASVRRFQLTLSVVSKSASDLALYLFVFILTHSLFEIVT